MDIGSCSPILQSVAKTLQHLHDAQSRPEMCWTITTKDKVRTEPAGCRVSYKTGKMDRRCAGSRFDIWNKVRQVLNLWVCWACTVLWMLDRFSNWIWGGKNDCDIVWKCGILLDSKRLVSRLPPERLAKSAGCKDLLRPYRTIECMTVGGAIEW